MALFQTILPPVEPVTLSEVKAYLRLEHDSEDQLLGSLIGAARQDVEASCGLALVQQSWRVTLDDLPRSGCVPLRRYPVRGIGSITVYGPDGEASLLQPETYRLENGRRPAILHFLTMPTMQAMANGMEIDFIAGFGESSVDVPDLLKRAITVLVAHWFEFRANYSASQQPVSYPAGYERLIAPWRERRL